jgi:hypothetical protein
MTTENRLHVWTLNSALWQLAHGEYGTAKTLDAHDYLDSEATDTECAMLAVINDLRGQLAATITAHRAVTTPARLIGHDVVASVAMPDHDGLLPQRHIVVLHHTGEPESRAYSTHYVAWQDGYGWAATTGHYGMSRDIALTNMMGRERNER